MKWNDKMRDCTGRRTLSMEDFFFGCVCMEETELDIDK